MADREASRDGKNEALRGCDLMTNHKIVWLPVKDANGDVKDSYGRVLCQKHSFPMYSHNSRWACPLCSNERNGWGFKRSEETNGN